jgi:hypothetical protein
MSEAEGLAQFDTRKTTYAEFVGVVADPATKELRVLSYISGHWARPSRAAGLGPAGMSLDLRRALGRTESAGPLTARMKAKYAQRWSGDTGPVVRL